MEMNFSGVGVRIGFTMMLVLVDSSSSLSLSMICVGDFTDWVDDRGEGYEEGY